METVMISESQAATFRLINGGAVNADFAKQMRRSLWAAVKMQHGLPLKERFSVSTDPTNPNYRVVKRKGSGEPVAEPASRVRYGGAEMATIKHFLANQFPDARSVPVGATQVGDGFFYEAGYLYFPLD